MTDFKLPYEARRYRAAIMRFKTPRAARLLGDAWPQWFETQQRRERRFVARWGMSSWVVMKDRRVHGWLSRGVSYLLGGQNES